MPVILTIGNQSCLFVLFGLIKNAYWRENMRTIRFFITMIAISLLITGCGVPSVESIVLDPDTTTVSREQIAIFTAKVVGSNYPPQNVTWSVSGGVEGTFIDADGVLNIGDMETAETVVVTATSIIDTRKSGKANVTISDPIDIVIGPGGGMVFYDKGQFSDGWRYLEAAPASSEFMAEWGISNYSTREDIKINTSVSIGSGKANTATIIEKLNANGEFGKAAQLCAALSINGLNDWFLPSKDELNAMYKFGKDSGKIGGFHFEEVNEGRSLKGWYWSSSSGDDAWVTWSQRFSDGCQVGDDEWPGMADRGLTLSVRAIRAF